MKSRKPIIWLSSPSRIVCLFSGLFTLILTTTNIISASQDGNVTDHLALLWFKSMITYDPYGVLTSWNTSFHFCDWSGVSCGKRHKRVTVLDLMEQGLEGTLSPHVGNLSFLRELWLYNNSFQGPIPHELGRLSRLLVLGLDQNKFSGIIPNNLSGCSNLDELYLTDNKLVGSIPEEISFLSKLTLLALHENSLTGGIPPLLGNITTMEVFSVQGNPLGGSIPHTLGHWKSLQEIYTGDCNLYGTIPHSIYNLSFITMFSLDNNKLTGTLPLTLGSTLPHLITLQLRDNQLSGLLPPSISNCSNLTILELQNNNFSGKVTVDFSKLRDISIISLFNNDLNGRGETDELKFIDSLKNCTSLESFDISSNKFRGVLPVSIGNLSHKLTYLNFGENQLYGNLPLGLGNLVGLARLNLEENQFTGKIPSIMGMLPKLQALYLNRNRFSGPIPDALGNLSMLIKLYLHSNTLEGSIPSSLGNCNQLLSLFLFGNKLSGKIPRQLFQISSLSITLDLSWNNLSGSLPMEVGDLKMLGRLELSYNRLSGEIPSRLGSCTTLSFLYIDHNLFRGIVPQSLSSLRGMLELDLSHNNLSGQIPRFLEQLSLEYVDLSYNDLQGEVPVQGVFTNASKFSVAGNSRLCGGLVELGLLKCKKKEKQKKRFPLFVIVILILSTLFALLCFVYAWFKKKNKRQQSQSSTDGRYLKVSYRQLHNATNGFSESDLIGEGGFSSVYKGILEQDDKVIAVKVLHLQYRGADRSFIAECEVWRSIRHRNLLKIITSCSGVDFRGNDFKALIYEFMPNRSLHDWLHSREGTSRLDLLQRIKILINVASAIDYLHNHCQAPIVHGDLKPTNILLDDDMVAHVGDFGLARFLRTDSYQNSSTGFRGTIGYAPPEYGLGGEMTISGDVYSFGILLLEAMTGKKPTDDIFNENLSLHMYAFMGVEEDHVMDVIDGEVVKFLDEHANAKKCTEANEKKIEESVASIVKIGISCTLDSPPHRMKIKNVAHELQHILDTIQNIIGLASWQSSNINSNRKMEYDVTYSA